MQRLARSTARVMSQRRRFGSSAGTISMDELKARFDSLVVIDVRSEEEVRASGKLGGTAFTLPLPEIQAGALQLGSDDFQTEYGFAKPDLNAEIVFSCAAGVRSAYAQALAQEAGFTSTLNYLGGANEWFSDSCSS